MIKWLNSQYQELIRLQFHKMAHFAEIKEVTDPTGFTSDSHWVVQRVVVIGNDVSTAAGPLGENDMHVDGETWCQNFFKRGIWKQTSYNTIGGKHNSGDDSKAFRGNFAGIGYIWDEDNNIFYPQKPYASWVLNTTDASWHSPIGDEPDDLTDEEKAAGTHYVWNEDGQSWDKETPEV